MINKKSYVERLDTLRGLVVHKFDVRHYICPVDFFVKLSLDELEFLKCNQEVMSEIDLNNFFFESAPESIALRAYIREYGWFVVSGGRFSGGEF